MQVANATHALLELTSELAQQQSDGSMDVLLELVAQAATESRRLSDKVQQALSQCRPTRSCYIR
jgi:hypothetical protein